MGEEEGEGAEDRVEVTADPGPVEVVDSCMCMRMRTVRAHDEERSQLSDPGPVLEVVDSCMCMRMRTRLERMMRRGHS